MQHDGFLRTCHSGTSAQKHEQALPCATGGFAIAPQRQSSLSLVCASSLPSVILAYSQGYVVDRSLGVCSLAGMVPTTRVFRVGSPRLAGS